MQYLGSIICSTNKIDPKIFLTTESINILSILDSKWNIGGKKACFYAFMPLDVEDYTHFEMNGWILSC